MTDVFLGQIMMTSFGYAQKGFLQCNGTLLSIQQYSALFSLLGTYYGGNGVSNFQLPDLRSRTPAGGGFSSADPGYQPVPYPLGIQFGVESVSLLASQIPTHNHQMNATSANATDPVNQGGETLATIVGGSLYGAPTNLVPLAGGPLSPAGSGLPHPNLQPYETINFNIAISGVYPSRG